MLLFWLVCVAVCFWLLVVLGFDFRGACHRILAGGILLGCDGFVCLMLLLTARCLGSASCSSNVALALVQSSVVSNFR